MAFGPINNKIDGLTSSLQYYENLLSVYHLDLSSYWSTFFFFFVKVLIGLLVTREAVKDI